MNAVEAKVLAALIDPLVRRGQVEEAHDLLAPVLRERTPFRYLDRIGAAAGAGLLPVTDQLLERIGLLPATDHLLERIAAERSEGGWVIVGAVLRRQLPRDLAGPLARCRSMTMAADIWDGADILGERSSL